MHVAIMHYSAPPIIGGVETVIRAHTELLLAAGHRVTILAGRGRAFDGRAPVRRIALIDSTSPEILAINEELAHGIVSERFTRAEAAIRKELKHYLENTDILIAHNVLSLHKNLPLTAALWHLRDDGVHTPLIAWCHDLAWTSSQYLPVLHEREPWTLLKKAIPGARYVAVSDDRAHQLAELWGTSTSAVTVVPNGVEAAALLRLSPVARRLASRLRLWEHDLVLLLPARMTRRKNIELAIRITASLVARGVAARLIVTGPPGPHNVANKRYVEELDRLRHSLGVEREAVLLYLEQDSRGRPLRVSDRGIADLYVLSDALLFPSRQEGFGIPVLEAGLVRIPVFCTDLEPLRQLGADNAYYFDPDADPDSVAAMIEDWMHHSRAYRLRQRVLKRYTWQAIYDHYIEPLLLSEVQRKSNANH